MLFLCIYKILCILILVVYVLTSCRRKAAVKVFCGICKPKTRLRPAVKSLLILCSLVFLSCLNFYICEPL
ncbi:hypothetical protein GDO81_016288 [Engystomops pustulosus]|uniref:Uncharacterized protein n=1 Tax=Engystomops pustulosus TaxID=76066 RepID=A0AAV7B108_ENGPU|nr:hypothetical protein GDO81_016288 [Engystomops pustulosus]